MEAQPALQEAEERYRALFNAIDQGFCTIEVVFDEQGTPKDYRFLEVSPSFPGQTGIENAVGRWMRDIAPDHDQHWFDIYGRVARTGEPAKFENYSTPLDRWWDVYAFKVGGDGIVAILFRDITEQKRAEAAVRASEERQKFLLNLSDTIRRLSDPIDIQGEITRAVGEFAQAHWVYYFDIDEELNSAIVRKDYIADDVPSMVGQHPLGDLGGLVDLIRSGRPFSGDIATMSVVSDRAREQYLGIGLRSFICAPVVKDGKVVAALNVADTIERDWRPLEAIVEEVAERTWQAVAQAQTEAALRESEVRLRQSEQSLQLALKVGRLATWDWDIANDQLNWSDEHYRMEGYELGEVRPSYESWRQRVHPEDLVATEAALESARASHTEYIHTFRSLHPDGTTVWLAARGRYFYNDDGSQAVRMIGVMEDVTEAHLAEAALKESEERLRQFGEASSDVLWIWNAQTLEFEYLSPAFDTMFGVNRASHDAKGLKYWAQLIDIDDRSAAIDSIRQVRAGNRSTQEFRIQRQSDGQERWIQNTAFPLLDDKGQVQHLGGIGQDVTDIRRAAERTQVLVEELQHRTRNLIAVISSIAQQTADTANDLPAFIAAFKDRLSALSRVQGLLSRKESEPITIWALVDLELQALGVNSSDQVSIVGPAVLVPASSVQTLSLALHELATNAKKYGALANGTGNLSVHWELVKRRREDRGIRLTWIEEGISGPSSDETVKSGFGSVLITQALPYSLGADTTYELTVSALRCTIELPLQETEGEPQK